MYYIFKISVKKFWTLCVPCFFLLIICGGLAGFFFVDRLLMPNMTNLKNRDDVTIPLLVDMSLDSANQIAYDLGLRISKGAREYDSTKSVNMILAQDPQHGEKVKKGRHIFVTLSDGSEVATVPQISKLSEGPAKQALRRAGFEKITVRMRYSESISLNSAIGTDPVHATVTSREIPLVLYLSRGQRPTHVVVPNLVGEMLSEVRQLLDEKDLTVGRVSYEKNTVMKPGQVISQSLTPGANVALESKVDIVVAIER